LTGIVAWAAGWYPINAVSTAIHSAQAHDEVPGNPEGSPGIG
jgi:hypothetical protein